MLKVCIFNFTLCSELFISLSRQRKWNKTLTNKAGKAKFRGNSEYFENWKNSPQAKKTITIFTNNENVDFVIKIWCSQTCLEWSKSNIKNYKVCKRVWLCSQLAVDFFCYQDMAFSVMGFSVMCFQQNQ